MSRRALQKRSGSGGTNLIGAGNLSQNRIFVGVTGAVSQYNLFRSQKAVKVQDFNSWQMRMPALSGAKGPGARTITNLSREQEQKQKP